MSRDTEIRYWRAPLDVRSAPGALRRIGGLAAPYGQRSALLPGGFYWVIETRAMAKTLGDMINVTALLEHHPEWLLGSVDSDTLRLDNQPDGLHYEVDLPNTSAGRDTYELTSSRRIKGTSIGFHTFDDEFRREGLTVVRHLVSIRLAHVAPTAQPAYPSTVTAVRSLAQKVDAPYEDVAALAAQGELRSLFMRTDQAVAAPPTIEPGVPTPLAVAQRSHDGGLDVRRRRLESEAKRIQMDTGNRPDEPRQMSLEQRLLELRRRKVLWDAPVEARSFPVGDLDRFGYPARRNSNGHAID
jgi:HK97 family phage prohead protease